MPSPAFTRALLVEDLADTRRWLRAALAAAFPGIVVSEAATLAEGLLAATPAPDLALVDLGLPDGSGVQLIEALLRRVPACVCVVVTVFDDDGHLFPALRAGAQGYLLKDQPPLQLAETLRGIVAGQPPLSPSIARRLLGHFRALPAAGPALAVPEGGEALTARETDVLRLVAKGYTLPQTADALSLSRHTVSGYLKDVYRKLAVSSRAEATIEAARRGLIAP